MDKTREYAKDLEEAREIDAMEVDDVMEVDKDERPSEYLRRRCPMCFGGDWSTREKRFVSFLNVLFLVNVVL